MIVAICNEYNSRNGSTILETVVRSENMLSSHVTVIIQSNFVIQQILSFKLTPVIYTVAMFYITNITEMKS